MKTSGLPKKIIIKSSADFGRVFKSGTVHKGKYFILFILKSSSRRVGFTIEKGIKPAVKRNRIKRKSREVWRLCAWQYEPVTMIMLAKRTVLHGAFDDLKNDFIALMNRAAVQKT